MIEKVIKVILTPHQVITKPKTQKPLLKLKAINKSPTSQISAPVSIKKIIDKIEPKAINNSINGVKPILRPLHKYE